MLRSLLRTLRGYVAVLNADPAVPVFPPRETEITRERKDTPRWVHLALFIATFLTTTLAGAGDKSDIIAMLVSGLPFSLTLMAILLTHEMGHYLAARRFGLGKRAVEHHRNDRGEDRRRSGAEPRERFLRRVGDGGRVAAAPQRRQRERDSPGQAGDDEGTA